jgi:hypothetical protein
MAAKQRIKRARITHISLCPRGKNRLKAAFQADEDGNAAFQLRGVTQMDEQGLLTACVFLPESAGVPSTDGLVFESQGLIDTAHQWLTECIAGRGGIDVRHDFEALPATAVQICESFIIQKGDPRFVKMEVDGKPVDATGGWGAVFKIHDAKLREKYRKGEWQGISMAGLCEVEAIQMADNDPTKPMDPEIKLLLQGLADGLKAVQAAVTPKQPVDTKTPVSKIPFPEDGDPTDPIQLAAHAEKLVLAECDLSTSEGIAKWTAYLAKKNAKATPAPATPAPGATKGFQFAAGLDDDAALAVATKEAMARINGGK